MTTTSAGTDGQQFAHRDRAATSGMPSILLPRTNVHTADHRTLLWCGIVSAGLYAALNVFVALQWPGYSSLSQTVSELSAVDAPTRWLWVPFATVYTLLTAAFGWGVRHAAVENPPLRVAGGFLVAYGISGLLWPLFPMHLREVLAAGGATWTDTAHLTFTAFTVLLMLLAMAFGAAAIGPGFRLYTVVTIALLATFGALTGSQAAAVETNTPTPWIGLYERLNIGVFLVWTVVLAGRLLRGEGSAPTRTQEAP